MYTNHFHDLIDSSVKLKNVRPHEDIPDDMHASVQEIILSLKREADGVICFSSVFELVPDVDLQPDIFLLPYTKCWFEFDVGEGQFFGLFCLQDKNEIVINVFTKGKNGPWIFSGTSIVACNEKNKLNTRWAGFESEARSTMIMCMARYLMALNCCNITRTEHKPKPSQQSVRRALGRQPLFSTWTLEIDLDRTEREVPGESCGGHTSKRLHLCRGHARQHKPGKWCWVRAHVRGDKSLGMVHKDYATH